MFEDQTALDLTSNYTLIFCNFKKHETIKSAKVSNFRKQNSRKPETWTDFSINQSLTLFQVHGP